MGKVKVLGLGKVVVQTEDDLLMMLFHLGVSGIVKVFDLTKFNDCDPVGITLEEFLGCENMEPDVVG